MRGFWTCQRSSGGVKCRASNPNRLQKCARCGKRRPDRKRPAHLSALNLPYEYFVEVNGGEHCGICGKVPEPGKKLHRDHEHVGVGFARGVLCFPCNLQLKHSSSVAWLRAAADYLERAEQRRPAA